jgi:hypothetical protein
MRRLLLLLCVLFLPFLSCSTYYTRLYLIGEPPKDYLTWDGDEIISDLQGWKFNLEVVGSIKNPNQKDVFADSFGVHISAVPGSSSSLGKDKINIEQPTVILGTNATRVDLIPYSNYTAQGAMHFNYKAIHIPAAEQYILVELKLILTKSGGVKYEKECKYTLHRYESKEKGVPKGLFN